MFSHVMIGSNDLTRSKAFYDATFIALGGKAGEVDAGGRLVYARDGSRLMITTPINGQRTRIDSRKAEPYPRFVSIPGR